MPPADNVKLLPRIALLVDGENISSGFAGKVITHAAKFGHITIKRVYGDAARLDRWDAAPGFRLIHSGSGKNSADILLSIEAVDLAHVSAIDSFAIATSDRDFSHLAHHLRERNFKVIGIGEAKAPDAFRKACTEFFELAAKAAPAPKNLDDLDKKIHKLIGKAPKMHIATLGRMMNKNYGVKISEHQMKKWPTYLAAKPDLYDCDPKGPEACVRLVNR
jgi:hypothetical protein